VIRISSEDLENIKAAAKKSGKTLSDFVLDAVKIQMGDIDNFETRLSRLESIIPQK
jgi:uncharacterized protein (DUF1778 family)